MGPFAAMAIGAAVPALAGALIPKPKAPNAAQFQIAGPQWANREKYINGLLDAAYNPNSEIYRLAADQMAQQVNQQIAGMGLGGSSMALGAMRSSQADLANKFIMDQVQRMQGALGLVTDYDRARAMGDVDVAKYNAGVGSNFAMADYNQRMQNRAGLISGIGGAVGTGMQMYNQNQMMDRLEDMSRRNNAHVQTVFGLPGLQPFNSSLGQIGGQ